jgi:hypothetical protein
MDTRFGTWNVRSMYRAGSLRAVAEEIPRCRWVNNIKMDLRGIGWGGMDWIDPAKDRDQWRALLNTVMNFRVP